MKILMPCRSFRVTMMDFRDYVRETGKSLPDIKLLWLNKFVCYRKKTMLINEFLNAGIVSYNQLINMCDYIRYDDLANQYG